MISLLEVYKRRNGVLFLTMFERKTSTQACFLFRSHPISGARRKNCAFAHFRTSSKSIALTLVFLLYGKIAFYWRFCRVNCVRGANEGVVFNAV